MNDNDLRDLARKRGTSVADYLSTYGKIESKRIYFLDSKLEKPGTPEAAKANAVELKLGS